MDEQTFLRPALPVIVLETPPDRGGFVDFDGYRQFRLRPPHGWNTLTLMLQHPRIPRRVALQAGSIGLLGLGMNHRRALEAMAAESGVAAAPRAKSAIYIFLSGGPSQHDTFDPKPDAPAGIRGEFDSIATATPGVIISEHLPLLAARSDKWSLVRSLTHPDNEHGTGTMIMLTGTTPLPPGVITEVKPRLSDWPSIACVGGAMTRPRNNLPPAVVLPERLIHKTGPVFGGQYAGMLGPQHDPWFVDASPLNKISYGAYPDYEFEHARGKMNVENLVFQAPHLSLPQGLSSGRVAQRSDLLALVEGQQRFLDRAARFERFDHFRQHALSLLTESKVQEAFNVVNAEPKLLDRYGRNSFGWSLLMARRLIESGVNLVEVHLGNCDSWDTHVNNFVTLKEFLLPPTDRAVSGLLDDLSERGLLDDTLVVMAGEFGRTPNVVDANKAHKPGRNHWGAVQTVFFAGGGTQGGRIVGSSDAAGAYPASHPQRPEDFAATIYHALGIPATAVWKDVLDRPHQVYAGTPIVELF